MRPFISAAICRAHRVVLLIGVSAAVWLGGCEEPLDPVVLQRLMDVESVAVVPFVDAHTAKGSGELVVGKVMEQLYRCPDLRVYERSQLKVLMDEYDLMAIASETEMASRVGQLTGVDAVILGELTQYQALDQSSGLTVYVVSGSSTVAVHHVGISVRAVRVGDLRVIYAESGGGTSQDGYNAAAGMAAEAALRPWLTAFRQRNQAQ